LVGDYREGGGGKASDGGSFGTAKDLEKKRESRIFKRAGTTNHKQPKKQAIIPKNLGESGKKRDLT